MDYALFKALQVLLFFGAALGFGVWQLASLRRYARRQKQRDSARQAPIRSD